MPLWFRSGRISSVEDIWLDVLLTRSLFISHNFVVTARKIIYTACSIQAGRFFYWSKFSNAKSMSPALPLGGGARASFLNSSWYSSLLTVYCGHLFVGGFILSCGQVLLKWYMRPFQNMFIFIWVYSFVMIFIRISDLRSLRLWYIKGADESFPVNSFIVSFDTPQSEQSWITDPDPDHTKGIHPVFIFDCIYENRV